MITTGPLPPNPAELLGSQRMRIDPGPAGRSGGPRHHRQPAAPGRHGCGDPRLDHRRDALRGRRRPDPPRRRPRAAARRWPRRVRASSGVALNRLPENGPAAATTTTSTTAAETAPAAKAELEPRRRRRRHTPTRAGDRYARAGGRPMRVLIIGINYRPELTAVGPYTAGLAEHLVARGDERHGDHRPAALPGLADRPRHPTLAPPTPRRSAASTVIRAAHYVPATSQDASGGPCTKERSVSPGSWQPGRLPRPDAILGIVPSLSGGILARLTGEPSRRPLRAPLPGPDGPGREPIRDGRRRRLSRGRPPRPRRWAIRRRRRDRGRRDVVHPVSPLAGRPDVDRIAHVPNWTILAAPELTVAGDARPLRLGGRRAGRPACGEYRPQARSRTGRRGRAAGRRAMATPVRFVLSGGGNQAATIRAAAATLQT